MKANNRAEVSVVSGWAAIDDSAIAPGARVGAYRIDAWLGAGGMCEVWAATHVLLGRRAAIN